MRLSIPLWRRATGAFLGAAVTGSSGLRRHIAGGEGRRVHRRRRRRRDDQGPDRTCGHRLQLEHRARARRAAGGVVPRRRRLALSRHRGDGEPGDRALPLAQRAIAARHPRTELPVRPAGSATAAEEVHRPRRHARPHANGQREQPPGRGQRAPAGVQRRAGVEDRQRDRHRHARRSVPLSRDPREPAQPAHAGVEGRQQRPAPASHRDVVPGDEHVVDGRLRAHRRARRCQGRP